MQLHLIEKKMYKDVQNYHYYSSFSIGIELSFDQWMRATRSQWKIYYTIISLKKIHVEGLF